MKKQPQPVQKGWDKVATWYDEYLEASTDTYQAQVIAPHLMRLIAPKAGQRVLDLACGQGYFARLAATSGAQVTGVDISAELIKKAQEKDATVSYVTAPADATTLKGASYDTVFTVLAFENIKALDGVVAEVHRVMKAKATFVLVMLHPAFRTPQHTDWYFDTKKGVQYRTVGKYLSEVAVDIEQHPFKGAKKVVTKTYHRSLQWYTKLFKKHGFAIASLEEWVSHKKSQPGPRKSAEDAARKEIPMFLALELVKR